MKKKYVNIFWALLAIAITLNELFVSQIQLETSGNIKFGTWLLIFLWASIAAQNLYSFYLKSKLEHSTPRK